MKTVTVQIGNSDDKLTQREWADFVSHVDSAIQLFSSEVHFSGVSYGASRWQNAAWVIACTDRQSDIIRKHLEVFRSGFNQDSIAWTEGETTFIKGEVTNDPQT